MSQRNDSQAIVLGFLLVLGINAAVLAMLIVFGGAVYFAVCFSAPTPTSTHINNWLESLVTGLTYIVSSLGVVQLLYVVPLILIFKRQQKLEWMKGIIIGAIVTALLNAVFFFK